MSSEKNIKIFKRSTKIIGVIILLFLCLEGVEYELIQIGKFVVSFILLGLAYLNKEFHLYSAAVTMRVPSTAAVRSAAQGLPTIAWATWRSGRLLLAWLLL